MLNLDLLFWASDQTGDSTWREMAISHAKVTQKNHIRDDYSTFHVVNMDQTSGARKSRFTNQGYSDSSCWTRGQSWSITGFIQTYHWTKDISFLETSRQCADYFLARLPADGVPPWDFDAPVSPRTATPTDTSAALIAAYGLLLLHEALVALEQASSYHTAALRIMSAICKSHLSTRGDGQETIVLGATINNYEFAPRRWANHGLVYADYYFLLVGNKLLEMGLGDALNGAR